MIVSPSWGVVLSAFSVLDVSGWTVPAGLRGLQVVLIVFVNSEVIIACVVCFSVTILL